MAKRNPKASSNKPKNQHALVSFPFRPSLRLKFSRSAPTRRLLPDSKRLQKVLQDIWSEHGQPPAEVEVNFVDANTICRLHQEYLGDPSPTDIVTFDLGETPNHFRLAALYICLEVAGQHARRYRASFAEEIRRLVIHGILHLLGYDDRSTAARRQMRRRENQILKLVTQHE